MTLDSFLDVVPTAALLSLDHPCYRQSAAALTSEQDIGAVEKRAWICDLTRHRMLNRRGQSADLRNRTPTKPAARWGQHMAL